MKNENIILRLKSKNNMMNDDKYHTDSCKKNIMDFNKTIQKLRDRKEKIYTKIVYLKAEMYDRIIETRSFDMGELDVKLNLLMNKMEMTFEEIKNEVRDKFTFKHRYRTINNK